MEFTEVTKSLLSHGVLGVMCVIALYVAYTKDRAMTLQQKEFQLKTEQYIADFHKEMQIMQERFILRSETWMSKYHELADSMQSVIKSLQEWMSRHKETGKF